MKPTKTIHGNLHFYWDDCMEIMAQYPDGYFDLAVVDPPYGMNVGNISNKSRSKLAVAHDYPKKDWDKTAPDPEFFDLLRRKSNRFIIFGANHFLDQIPFNISSPCWIVWDKMNGENDFADCELALTNFNTAVRMFSFKWAGMLQGNMKKKEKRIHPTQKPVALYRWIYDNYAQPGIKVLDTHLGSGSNAIAAHYFGVSEFVGIELDEDYFNDAMKRIDRETRQIDMFQEMKKSKQGIQTEIDL